MTPTNLKIKQIHYLNIKHVLIKLLMNNQSPEISIVYYYATDKLYNT